MMKKIRSRILFWVYQLVSNQIKQNKKRGAHAPLFLSVFD